MIERLTTSESCVDPDAETLLDLLLADELGQSLRAERELDDRFIGERLGGCDLGA
jgi:hypothetical protein